MAKIGSTASGDSDGTAKAREWRLWACLWPPGAPECKGKSNNSGAVSEAPEKRDAGLTRTRSINI